MMPPVQQGQPPFIMPVMGGGKGGKGRRPAAEQERTSFRPAEMVLGPNCPPGLAGHLLPFGMTFKNAGKTLADPPKVRLPGDEFKHPCKCCWKLGHEAFECREDFVVDGKPSMGFRKLYEMKLPDGRSVCNAQGFYAN